MELSAIILTVGTNPNSLSTALQGISAVDVGVLLLIIVFALRCAFRGFVREIMVVAGLLVGVLAGFLFSGMLAPVFEHWMGRSPWNHILAFIAIFIGCLGLFGLVTFMANQKTKEIGVRKVLGASVFNLWSMLSKEFVVLVAISFIIAVPVSYYFMHGWLQSYQYRAALSWWIFAAAGAGALIITILTVSFRAIKAALANPTRSLRSE